MKGEMDYLICDEVGHQIHVDRMAMEDILEALEMAADDFFEIAAADEALGLMDDHEIHLRRAKTMEEIAERLYRVVFPG